LFIPVAAMGKCKQYVCINIIHEKIYTISLTGLPTLMGLITGKAHRLLSKFLSKWRCTKTPRRHQPIDMLHLAAHPKCPVGSLTLNFTLKPPILVLTLRVSKAVLVSRGVHIEHAA